ncbi:MAG TPA: LysE family translocator [Micromonosporaceae bacterium]
MQTLRNARREPQAHPARADFPPTRHASWWRAFTTGVATDLLNVKVAVFYVTFLPQFVDPGPHFTWRMSLLCLLFEGLASAWYLVYIALIHRLHTFIARPAVRRTLSRLTGATLIGMGVKLALDKRP